MTGALAFHTGLIPMLVALEGSFLQPLLVSKTVPCTDVNVSNLTQHADSIRCMSTNNSLASQDTQTFLIHNPVLLLYRCPLLSVSESWRLKGDIVFLGQTLNEVDSSK